MRRSPALAEGSRGHEGGAWSGPESRRTIGDPIRSAQTLGGGSEADLAGRRAAISDAARPWLEPAARAWAWVCAVRARRGEEDGGDLVTIGVAMRAGAARPLSGSGPDSACHRALSEMDGSRRHACKKAVSVSVSVSVSEVSLPALQSGSTIGARRLLFVPGFFLKKRKKWGAVEGEKANTGCAVTVLSPCGENGNNDPYAPWQVFSCTRYACHGKKNLHCLWATLKSSIFEASKAIGVPVRPNK